MSLIKYLMLSFCIMFVFGGCQKNATGSSADKSECQDFTWAEGVFNDATNMMDEAAISNKLVLYDVVTQDSLVPTCSSIHKYNANSSDLDTILIDFGTSDCLCADNRYRRGQIIAIYNPPLYNATSNVINISFNNYYVNDYLIQGTKKITNLGRNILGQLQYSSMVNGNITNPNNQIMSFKSNETKLWVVGDTNIVWYNNVYQISGNSFGTAFNGIAFTDTISSPLIIEGSCQYIAGGIVSLTPNGNTAQTINFGNGACSDALTLTIDGNDYLIIMH